jgi:hypothetical protein
MVPIGKRARNMACYSIGNDRIAIESLMNNYIIAKLMGQAQKQFACPIISRGA